MKTHFFQLTFLLYLSASFSQFIVAQSNFDPTFDTFKATAHTLPKTKNYELKYHPKHEEQPVLAEFEWEEINIPETDDKELFPDVGKRYGFSVVFKSNMKISKKGIYKFSLNSDDGSILWIGKKAVLLNDGIHQMRYKEDSLALAPGTYPIKIWYFQKFPDRFGIQFNGSFYREMKENESVDPIETHVTKNLKLVIPNQILNFEHDSYQVDVDAKIFLDSISNKILTFKNIESLKISGHTDDTGNEIYNSELSIKRAITIQGELMKRIKDPLIKYEVKGLGESRPIAPNNSDENRKKNRRVEVEVILKKG